MKKRRTSVPTHLVVPLWVGWLIFAILAGVGATVAKRNMDRPEQKEERKENEKPKRKP